MPLPTVRKALRALVDDGAIARSGRRYHAVGPLTPVSHSTVYVVEWGPPQELIVAVDAECSRRAFRTKTVRFLPTDNLVRTLRRSRESAAGYVFLVIGGSYEQYYEIVQSLMPLDLPVAVVDIVGSLSPGAVFAGGRFVRAFRIASGERPGYVAGRFLLGQGHRRVAFLSAFHEVHWSVERLKGLKAAFAQAGLDDGVGVFVSVTRSFPSQDALRAARDVDWLLGTGLGPQRPRQTRLRRALSRLKPQLNAMMQWSQVEDNLVPLMQRALTSGATAWLAANDQMAFACLEFLRGRGVAVPNDISVMGFDNTPVSFSAGLTTYDFNAVGAVHAAVAFIAGGGTLSRRSHRQIITMEGHVEARATTDCLIPVTRQPNPDTPLRTP